MKTIGQNFVAELKAAGLGDGLTFVIGGTEADISGVESLSAADRATFDAILAAHVAPTALQRDQLVVWERIKERRYASEEGGALVGTLWFHTDEESRIKYQWLLRKADSVLAAGGAASTVLQHPVNGTLTDINWKTMSGVFVPMTVQSALDVADAVASLDLSAFQVAEQHRAAMELAADPLAYDFSTGWPATFPA